MKPWTHYRAQVARAQQTGDVEAADQARRALALVRTEDKIRRAIEAAPPLDAATLARIRSLIPAAPAAEAVATR